MALTLKIIVLFLLSSNLIFAQQENFKGSIKLIEEFDYDSNDKLITKTTYNFFTNNKLQNQVSISPESGQIRNKMCFYYREDNSLLKSEYYMFGIDTTDVLSHVVHEFDLKGSIIKSIEPNRETDNIIESGEVMSVDFPNEFEESIQFKYDNIGNWVLKEIFINQKKSKTIKRQIEYNN